MSETSEVQKPIMKYARKRGCLVWKVSAESKKDFPDLLILFGCVWMVIECKKKGKPLRPGQVREQNRIRLNGGLAYDTDNIEEGMMLIDMLVDKKFDLHQLDF